MIGIIPTLIGLGLLYWNFILFRELDRKDKYINFLLNDGLEMRNHVGEGLNDILNRAHELKDWRDKVQETIEDQECLIERQKNIIEAFVRRYPESGIVSTQQNTTLQ